MRIEWASWKAATRCLFWRAVEMVTFAVTMNKQAARQLTALNPDKPQDCFDQGFAVFIYDISWDRWHGYWRKQEEPRYVAIEPQFTCEKWAGVPWHPVTFKSIPKLEGRAVDLEFARERLYNPMYKAA